MVLRFKPQHVAKKQVLKARLAGGYTNYNFVSRDQWYPAGWKSNQIVIGKQFAKLHYLTRHGPVKLRTQWNDASNVFEKRHFGGFYASVRYLNNWSCHQWL